MKKYKCPGCENTFEIKFKVNVDDRKPLILFCPNCNWAGLEEMEKISGDIKK